MEVIEQMHEGSHYFLIFSYSSNRMKDALIPHLWDENNAIYAMIWLWVNNLKNFAGKILYVTWNVHTGSSATSMNMIWENGIMRLWAVAWELQAISSGVCGWEWTIAVFMVQFNLSSRGRDSQNIRHLILYECSYHERKSKILNTISLKFFITGSGGSSEMFTIVSSEMVW